MTNLHDKQLAKSRLMCVIFLSYGKDFAVCSYGPRQKKKEVSVTAPLTVMAPLPHGK